MQETASRNADLVVATVKEHLNVVLDYDESSVAWLDGYIERSRKELKQETIEKLIDRFGCFLGECIRRNYGGQWAGANGTWAIKFDDRNKIYPFNKVAKQFQNGSEDSILSFYTLIPIIFKQSIEG
jgi:hypothetical protein